MIASVRGAVLSVGLDSAVARGRGSRPARAHDARHGRRRCAAAHEARLATTLVVREESLTLYGFADDDERDVFEQVQTVSGVGPRLALAMLAVHAPDALRAAVSTGDLAALTKVPGIGKKGAERIVLELRDKIGLPSGAAGAARRRPGAGDRRRGAGRSARRSSGSAGRSSRPTTPSTGSPPRPATAVTSPALLRAALRELGR